MYIYTLHIYDIKSVIGLSLLALKIHILLSSKCVWQVISGKSSPLSQIQEKELVSTLAYEQTIVSNRRMIMGLTY